MSDLRISVAHPPDDAAAAVNVPPVSPAVEAFSSVILKLKKKAHGDLTISVPARTDGDIILSLADRMIAAASESALSAAGAGDGVGPGVGSLIASPVAPRPSSAASVVAAPISAASSRQEFFTPPATPRVTPREGSVTTEDEEFYDWVDMTVAQAVSDQVPTEVARNIPHHLRRVENGFENLRAQAFLEHDILERVRLSILLISEDLDQTKARLAWAEQIQLCRRHHQLKELDATLVRYLAEGRMPAHAIVTLHKLMLARREELHANVRAANAWPDEHLFEDPAVVRDYNFELSGALRERGLSWL